MRKSFINLKHPDSSDTKFTSGRIKGRASLLCELSQHSLFSLLSFLKLSEIATFYNTIQFTNRYRELRNLIMNYLILCNRTFSKSEEKEFLDVLLMEMQDNKEANIVFCKQAPELISTSMPSNENYQYNPNLIKTPHSNSQSSIFLKNERSHIIKMKESIVYDVDRTYYVEEENSFGTKSLELCLGNRGDLSKLNENESYYSESPRLLSFPNSEAKSKQEKVSPNSDFTHNDLQKQMQDYLKNVLLNISQKYFQLGYIQGFNYIAKVMYLTSFTEKEAFNYLSYLIEEKSLGNIILNNMQGIKTLSYVLKVHIFNFIPKVYKHLCKAELEPELFCTSWFVTLFSEDLSVNVVNKLWHIFILDGWKTIIRFGIALLCAYEKEILAQDVDEVFCYMRRLLKEFNGEIEKNCKEKEREKLKEKSNIINKTRLYFKASNSSHEENRVNKEEIVWKLMASVSINGSIISQLCKEMNNLEKDSEIELWRLETPSLLRKNFQSSSSSSLKKHSSLSQVSSSTARQERPLKIERTSTLTPTQNYSFGEQLCCDRVTYTEIVPNGTLIPTRNHNSGMFALCHNVGQFV